MTTLKKNFEKSWSFIRKPQSQCRIFAPDLKVKAPQTVVRLSSEGSKLTEDVGRKKEEGKCWMKDVASNRSPQDIAFD